MGKHESHEQLAVYCSRLLEGAAWADTGEEAAKHIERELSWRPPARAIEGTDDFDALRSGAILRVTNGTTTSVWRKVGRQWESTEIGTGELCDSIDLDDFCRDEDATATVIFEPEDAR